MTPDQETDLFANIKYLIKVVENVQSKQDMLVQPVGALQGQVNTLQAWIQSADQRFVALMAPYQPSHTKAPPT